MPSLFHGSLYLYCQKSAFRLCHDRKSRKYRSELRTYFFVYLGNDLSSVNCNTRFLNIQFYYTLSDRKSLLFPAVQHDFVKFKNITDIPQINGAV